MADLNKLISDLERVAKGSRTAAEAMQKLTVESQKLLQSMSKGIAPSGDVVSNLTAALSRSGAASRIGAGGGLQSGSIQIMLKQMDALISQIITERFNQYYLSLKQQAA